MLAEETRGVYQEICFGAVESRGFFECFLVRAAVCMGFEDKIDASSQVDVTIVGFKGIFVILLQ